MDCFKVAYFIKNFDVRKSKTKFSCEKNHGDHPRNNNIKWKLHRL